MTQPFPNIQKEIKVIEKAMTPKVEAEIFDSSKNPSDDKIEVFDAAHAGRMMKTFNDLRKNNLFTDVILSVAGKEFACHRAVLVAGSNYFRAMFCNDHRESKEMLVQINGLQSEVMEVLLTFLYTAKTTIDQSNVQMLLEAANLFQIDLLRRNCTTFMEKQLDPCNCLGMKHFADAHGLEKLSMDAEKMILEKFMEVMSHDEFKLMPKEVIVDVIKGDDLEVNDEVLVYRAVKSWIDHDRKSRAKDVAELMSHVRFPLIHPTKFCTEIEADELLQTSMTLVPILAETRKYHILGVAGDSIRFKPRKISSRLDVLVSIGGSDRVGGYNAPYVEAWNPLQRMWKQFAKLPNFTKTDYSVCQCKNMIIVTGGKMHNKEVWIYQINVDQWIKGAPLNTGRYGHRMASCQGSPYVIGGFGGPGTGSQPPERIDAVEKYDFFNNCWKDMCSMIEAVANPAVSAYNAKIFCFGGQFDMKGANNKLQIYDSITNQWSLGNRTLSPQNPVAAASACGSIWILGGETSEIFKYKPSTDEWSQMAITLPNHINHCEMTTVNNKIYFTGILTDHPDPLLNIWSFCPTKGEIDTACGQMERYTCMHGVVCITLDKPEEFMGAKKPNRRQHTRSNITESFDGSRRPSETPRYRDF